MRERRKITASFWWHTVGNTFATLSEFLTRAQQADRVEQGHDCGHRFEITVRSSLHVSGPGEHTDADYYDGMRAVEVRAHNLRDALLIAATLPLSTWFDHEEEPDG